MSHSSILAIALKNPDTTCCKNKEEKNALLNIIYQSCIPGGNKFEAWVGVAYSEACFCFFSNFAACSWPDWTHSAESQSELSLNTLWLVYIPLTANSVAPISHLAVLTERFFNIFIDRHTSQTSCVHVGTFVFCTAFKETCNWNHSLTEEHLLLLPFSGVSDTGVIRD